MSQSFDRIEEIMAALRAPGGCPWDRKQTHASLKPYLLEEAYEALETIDQGNQRKLKEELGDVLLQVLFHSQIASESGTFTIEDVMEHLGDKLVRRHPHVFRAEAGGAGALNAEDVLHRWEDIKRAEREQSGEQGSVLQNIPKSLPALLRAYQVQARAARAGFDWPDNPQGLEQVSAKLDEELAELRREIHRPPDQKPSEAPERDEGPSAQREAVSERLEAEFGDVLFSVVNLARHLKVNPEDALRLATNRFATRFQFIEEQAMKTGRSLTELSMQEMDRYWAEAKNLERSVAASAGGPAAEPRESEP